MIDKRKLMMLLFGSVPFIWLVPNDFAKAEEEKIHPLDDGSGVNRASWSKDDIMIHNLLVHHISLVMKYYKNPEHRLQNVKSELDLMEEMGGIEHFHIVNGDDFMTIALLWRGEEKTRMLEFSKKPGFEGVDFVWTNSI